MQMVSRMAKMAYQNEHANQILVLCSLRCIIIIIIITIIAIIILIINL